jgi:hypothetical protein
VIFRSPRPDRSPFRALARGALAILLGVPLVALTLYLALQLANRISHWAPRGVDETAVGLVAW